MSILFQTGTIAGLLQGVYDGDMDYQTLATHGDIGVGTFNGVNGEMIALDGIFYRADATGHTSIVAPHEKTPFAVVSPYQPTLSFSIGTIKNSDALNAAIDAHLKTTNIFYMIRIDADIERVQLRSESCQALPYKPLAEALTETQQAFELSHIKGTLVTTRCPPYSGGMTIAGFHHHFISHDKTMSGHVFDVQLKKAEVHVTMLRQFNVQLMVSDAFDAANLDIDTHSLLKKTE